jgi:periplasmic copper chaperone A
MLKRFLMVVLSYAFVVDSAFAHITLEQKTAEAGSDYTAVFRVPHGCDGSATNGITVFLPADINDAKPVAKDGWSLSVKTEKLDKPRDGQSSITSDRVAQIAWSGGRLPATDLGEFVVRMTLPATPGKRWFHVIQQCEQGQNDWVAVPQEGQAKPSLPAPVLDVIAAPLSPR